MEPKHTGLEEDVPFQGRIFRFRVSLRGVFFFPPMIFYGCYAIDITVSGEKGIKFVPPSLVTVKSLNNLGICQPKNPKKNGDNPHISSHCGNKKCIQDLTKVQGTFIHLLIRKLKCHSKE